MSYAIHLTRASASFQYTANYSYICPYITCSFWHACRQMSPVRVTTWAALTSCLVPESLQLNTALRETWKKGHRKRLTSSKQIMNTQKLSASAESIVTSTPSQWKLYALWLLLNTLHFPTRFTILLLTIAGDWESVSRLWLKTFRGGMLCKTCVNRSYIHLKRRGFLFACPGSKLFRRMTASSTCHCTPLQIKDKPAVHGSMQFWFRFNSMEISIKTSLCFAVALKHCVWHIYEIYMTSSFK